MFYILESKTKASKGLSTGAVVGIIVPLVLVSLLVVVAVIFKCRKTYHRGDKLMMSKPTWLSDFRTRVASSFGREPKTEPLEEEDIDL